MNAIVRFLLGIAMLGFPALLPYSLIQPAAAGPATLVREISPADNERVRRNYRHNSRFLHSSYAILIDGTPVQIKRIAGWLDRIYAVPLGKRTINSIMSSRNHVVIRHSPWALHAAGRTSAPVSSHLTDGIGEDALVLFDSRIPDSGSHNVFNRHREPIEFNAMHNLFHELVHARHLVNGTWRYFDSEGQAIEEENRFRVQLDEIRGNSKSTLRVGIRGEQLWWPDGGNMPQ